MKPIVTLVAVAFAGTLGLFNGNTSNAQDVTRMREVVEATVKKGQFTGAVLITQGDRVLIDKGYGFANREWKQTNLPSTKFRIGSISKQFTAAAVLLLEERGKLLLSDSIKKYVPDTPAAWDGITIAHLFNHTAGLPNFTDLAAYQKVKMLEAQPADTLKLVRELPLDFAPGKDYRYSNSGYVLLGQIIETVTGESYGTFLQNNIFKPLGMADSSVDTSAVILPSRAAGYKYLQANEKAPPSLVNADVISMSVPHAAGAIISTTHDLHRWQKALYGAKDGRDVLSAASLKKMLAPNKAGYALGVQVIEKKQQNKATGDVTVHRVMEHGGGIDGFSAWMQYDEASALNVVVLGNIEGAPSGYLAGRLAAMTQGGLPYSTLPFYLRGTMNNWGISTPMVSAGSKIWAVETMLSAGGHEFKFGSEDFRQIDFGGGNGEPSIVVGTKNVLSIGGSNLKIEVSQAARYRFSLDVRDAYGPKLTVMKLIN